jgi:DNA invertase Pin-like site-specific DNA recombinase
VKSGKSSNISNKEVLELRLENKSYGEIAKLYKVSHMTIKRILNNMYPSLDKTTQEQLDNINKQLFCNKKY